MKTKILLFLSVLLININVFGQWDQVFDSYTYDFNYNSRTEFVDPLTEMDEDLKLFLEHVKSARDFNDLWMLDSLVYYDFITEIDSFSFEREIYNYSNEYNTVEYIVMERSGQEENWQNKTRYLLTFNENNVYTLSISFIWDEDQWLKERKTEYIYNENNSQTKRTILIWEQNQWVNYTKMEHHYNNNNESIEQSNYDWNNDNQTWFHSFKVEFGYDSQGLMNFALVYRRDYETNELIWWEKHETIYNEIGLLIEQIKSHWDQELEIWTPFNKLISSYEDGLRSNDTYWWRETGWQLSKQYDEFRIDSITTGSNRYTLIDDTLWLHTYKSEKGFDELGNLISWESYGFNETANRWYGVTKSFSSYNEDGQYNWHISYYWDNGISEWYNPIKREYGYNEQKLLFYRSDSYWNLETNTWRKYDSQIYYYTNVSSINENRNEYSFINVYPNPCNKQLNLDFENLNNEKVDFKIYSILGKIVNEGILDPVDINSINVSHLENGFYMILAISGKKKYSGKFIKF